MVYGAFSFCPRACLVSPGCDAFTMFSAGEAMPAKYNPKGWIAPGTMPFRCS
jgi:hypothetical protein